MSIIHADIATNRGHGVAAILERVGAAIGAACARAERSHQRRLGYASLTAETLRDIGMSAEDATGLPSGHPDLPFFMQTGFGRH